MNDTSLFFHESLPELRQRLSVGIVKRIDEGFPRFYLMYWGGEGAVFFECRDSALQKLMILMEKQPTTKKFCPSENDRRSGAGFPLSAFGHGVVNKKKKRKNVNIIKKNGFFIVSPFYLKSMRRKVQMLRIILFCIVFFCLSSNQIVSAGRYQPLCITQIFLCRLRINGNIPIIICYLAVLK